MGDLADEVAKDQAVREILVAQDDARHFQHDA
jgi:hypothetical protein